MYFVGDPVVMVFGLLRFLCMGMQRLNIAIRSFLNEHSNQDVPWCEIL